MVSVTPDTVEDPGLFDDLLPPDESRAHEDGQAAERPDTANFAENREEKGGAPPDQPDHREPAKRAKAAASVGASPRNARKTNSVLGFKSTARSLV